MDEVIAPATTNTPVVLNMDKLGIESSTEEVDTVPGGEEEEEE
jgi:hypothetical protein